jgi:alpha-mannosidase
MWGWDETVSITLETFRTMLDLMKEYPDYTFSQSQASVYRVVEDHDPAMLDEIRARVKEGRWEVTASTWTETDKNIPSGESQARHILYTKAYLSKLLNIDPDSLDIDFEPDTFGHNANVPEILNKGKVKYYYHCRGYEGHNLYRWTAPSGASILAYREPIWYNAHIEPSMAYYVPEFCNKNGLDTMLKVYGVGDHGGGPTRRDIERIIDMNSWPVFPTIKFGTFKEYFRYHSRKQHRGDRHKVCFHRRSCACRSIGPEGSERHSIAGAGVFPQGNRKLRQRSP